MSDDGWNPDAPVVEMVANIVERLTAVIALKAVDFDIEHRLEWVIADLEHVAGRIRGDIPTGPPTDRESDENPGRR